MLKRILIVTLCFLSAPTFADPKDDVALYMSNFIDPRTWDSAYGIARTNIAGFYRGPLIERGVVIVDEERFRELMPDIAATEAVQQLKSHIAAFIIESYGADHLSAIAAFFRTSAGENMLAIAKEKRLFASLFQKSPRGGPIDQWKNHLSLLELAQFRTFVNSPAGQVFVTQTWSVRKSAFYMIVERSRWPELPLDRPYIVEILKADGVLKFPNRVVRQSLISELSATGS